MPRDNLISILAELGEYEVRKKLADGNYFFESEVTHVKEWLEQQPALRALAKREEINPMKIFVSHITEELALAFALKDWVESSFSGQCDVFVSSDKDDIPAGTKWLDEIDRALGQSAALIVLCSPYSISRPWVNFEMGCGWIKRVPLIPICHSGQKNEALPPPISTFQGLELEDEDFIAALLSALAKHLKFPKVPRIDRIKMREDLLSAAGKSRAAAPSKMKELPPLIVEDLPQEAVDILK